MASLLEKPAELRALRTKARAFADFIKLPLRNRVWQGASGEFMGRGVGSSLDFQDHRVYVPGDDPRHINWQAYARTGQYSMKLYREEVRPVVDVVLDVSASMFFDEAKARRGLELFFFSVDAAQRSGASVRIYLLHGPEHKLLAPDVLLGDAWSEQVPPWSLKVPNTDPPGLAKVPLRPQSLRVFVTDLLYPGSPEAVVLPLSVRHGRGLLFVPCCHAESDATWDGNYEFIDPESGSHHLRRVEPGLLKRYHQAYRRHFDFWKGACQRHGVVMARVPAEPDFQRALQGEALGAGAVEML